MNSELKNLLKKRKQDTNKYDYGHVFILAGSAGMTGAAYLASQAAILAGSGLVTLGIPGSLNCIMACKLTEVMTRLLPETKSQTLSLKAYFKIMKLGKKADVLAIGPGLSVHMDTVKLVRKICANWDKPIVIDADGLNALAGSLSNISHIRSAKILTPHIGEFARLMGKPADYVKKNRERLTKEFAKRYNIVLVLKGSRSIVASPDGDIYINNTGNPGMASAGSGDVLTGIIASFAGQGIQAFEAAKLGVNIHGLAGDLAADEKGEASLIATDLLAKLPQAIKSATKR